MTNEDLTNLGIDEVYDMIDATTDELEAARKTVAELGQRISRLRGQAAEMVARREARFAGMDRTDLTLSAAEQRVAAYLRSPMGVNQIAHELHVSANTVKTHMKNIYRKLGVNTRAGVAAALTSAAAERNADRAAVTA